MKADPRIIQYKSAGEACSKRTFEKWEKERQEAIKEWEIDQLPLDLTDKPIITNPKLWKALNEEAKEFSKLSKSEWEVK